MKPCIAFITDTSLEQTNGVITTILNLKEEVKKRGYKVILINPDYFAHYSYPPYPEIKITVDKKGIRERLEWIDNFVDYYHIFTEGPLGYQANKWLQEKQYIFTTSYHTRWPEFLSSNLKIPKSLTHKFLKSFHRKAHKTLVPSLSIIDELEKEKYDCQFVQWTRGVDLSLFSPKEKANLLFERPIFTYLGRISREKNIEEFLSCDLPGSKMVIGDGPDYSHLKKKYPDVNFVGKKTGKDLVETLASSDVHVFPSKNDTFGVVNIEAMACGVPTAAHRVPGPMDILEQGKTGYMSDDLQEACLECLKIPSKPIPQEAKKFTWGETSAIFLDTIHHK